MSPLLPSLARRLCLVTLLVSAVPACGVLPSGTRANVHHGGAAPPTRATLRVPPAELEARNGVFVGIALSGGGSRAANFSAAVLLELEALGFLDAATALSSVSGSSLTAAYYGLYGRQPDRWRRERLEDLLGRDLEMRWLARWFLPQNMVRYWLTDFDRTDIMIGVLDGLLFDGKQFANLGTGLPRILINATRLSVGERLVFTDETFQALGSRLDEYPIASAVMASGAFPGVFQNVTLEDYSHRAPQAPRRFEHLFDGGAADNLGVNALLDMLRALHAEPARAPRGCFLFIVDAHTVNPEKKVYERDTRRAIDFFVDTNAIAASDVLLAQRRKDILERAGFTDTEIGRQPIQVFPVFGDDPARQAACPQCLCTAWHLTFQRLLAWRPAGEPGEPGAPLAQVPVSHAVFEDSHYAVRVGRVVNQIATRYKLTSPAACPSAALQQDLYAAARLLVREDKGSLAAACQWLRSYGLSSGRCDEEVRRPSPALGLRPACALPEPEAATTAPPERP